MKDFPAVRIVIAFVLGILSQRFIALPVELIFIPVFLLIISLLPALKEIIYRKYGYVFTVLTIIMIVMLGNVLIQISLIPSNQFFDKIYRFKNISATGKIIKIDLKRESELLFYTETDSIKSDDFFVKDKVELLCKFRDEIENINRLYDQLKPGYEVKISGTFYKGREQRNPGEFNYNEYLNSKGITGILLIDTISNIQVVSDEASSFINIIHQVRKTLDEQIEKYHSPETASLLRGLLLADRREIDYETKNQFINAGVFHVLAVSGLHVGYIVLIFLLIFGRFNLFLRSILTIVGLICFMLITGVPPSVFRATLMAVILIIAFLLNRSTNLINSIAIAALIILTVDPNEIYNPGFQLSFAAVLSIAIIYPLIERNISKLRLQNKALSYILLFIAVSFSAQVGTFPFTLLYFNKFSTIALLTNLLVIPAIGFIIGIALFTLAISIVFPFIAAYYASANDLITKFILEVIHFTGRLDFSHVVVNQYSITDLIIFYFFITVFLTSIFYFKKFIPKLILTVLIVFNIFIFSSLDDEELLPENVLSVFMIDIGQGDSFLIKFPNSKTALIDAGNTNFYFDNGERVIIPLLEYLDIDKIDYAFVSHIDADHYAGFVSLILDGKIKTVYKPKIDTSLSKDMRFEKFLNDFEIPITYYSKETLKIGNVNLYFLNYDKFINSTELESNNRSGIIKLTYGKSSFLFTGDLEKSAEKEYANKYKHFLDSDVLKVSHHGSKTSTSKEFLNFVTPDFSLISAGINNSFGHPTNEVLLRLNSFKSKILRTDLDKAVLLRSDGNKIESVNWKKL
jgi:competence protein ComEC